MSTSVSARRSSPCARCSGDRCPMAGRWCCCMRQRPSGPTFWRGSPSRACCVCTPGRQSRTCSTCGRSTRGYWMSAGWLMRWSSPRRWVATRRPGRGSSPPTARGGRCWCTATASISTWGWRVSSNGPRRPAPASSPRWERPSASRSSGGSRPRSTGRRPCSRLRCTVKGSGSSRSVSRFACSPTVRPGRLAHVRGRFWACCSGTGRSTSARRGRGRGRPRTACCAAMPRRDRQHCCRRPTGPWSSCRPSRSPARVTS